MTLLAALAAVGLTGCEPVTTGAPVVDAPPPATVHAPGDSEVPPDEETVPPVDPPSTGTDEETEEPSADPPPTIPDGSTSPARDWDVDGDGGIDQLALSSEGELTATYSGGGGDIVTLSYGIPEDLLLLGAVDADADGHAEVFARVVQGANAKIVTVLRYVDGHLTQVTMDGDDASLSLGGGVANQFSWACDFPTGEIVQWERHSDDDNQSFQGEVRRYRFEGSALTLTSRTPFWLGADEPLPGVPATSGCGSLDLSL
ncbi:RAD23 family protein [Frankia nepalensis]|uniref:Uncharacterized protein n=1 Tax=Frankia nepalensis TaxID=1836974 RepID=A0A937RJ60_9ACTN|nr:hypothetical protein [Frankia nepalensis]MBL7501127.1 hypothetical protein [Frankia nepalensis]MBL7515081.1 hypothetical protein [Frankia nepalensis]MBL7631295.1 hypothetical protein [Frankia nepalensis]